MNAMSRRQGLRGQGKALVISCSCLRVPIPLLVLVHQTMCGAQRCPCVAQVVCTLSQALQEARLIYVLHPALSLQRCKCIMYLLLLAVLRSITTPAECSTPPAVYRTIRLTLSSALVLIPDGPVPLPVAQLTPFGAPVFHLTHLDRLDRPLKHR